jgi:hypothetical protein
LIDTPITDGTADPRGPIDAFAEYYLKSGLVWGSADLPAVGSGDDAARAGAVAAFLRMLFVGDQHVFTKITIVWPPIGEESEISAQLKTGFADVAGLPFSGEPGGYPFRRRRSP